MGSRKFCVFATVAPACSTALLVGGAVLFRRRDEGAPFFKPASGPYALCFGMYRGRSGIGPAARPSRRRRSWLRERTAPASQSNALQKRIGNTIFRPQVLALLRVGARDAAQAGRNPGRAPLGQVVHVSNRGAAPRARGRDVRRARGGGPRRGRVLALGRAAAPGPRAAQAPRAALRAGAAGPRDPGRRAPRVARAVPARRFEGRRPSAIVFAPLDCWRRPLDGHSTTRTDGQDFRSAAVPDRSSARTLEFAKMSLTGSGARPLHAARKRNASRRLGTAQAAARGPTTSATSTRSPWAAAAAAARRSRRRSTRP